MVSRNCKLRLLLVRNFLFEQLNLADETTEDEKVSTDELQEKIAEFEDYVQSTDIAAMQSTSFGLQLLNPDSLFFFLDRTVKGERVSINFVQIRSTSSHAIRHP